MRWLFKYQLLVILSSFSLTVLGYEQPTHVKISEHAVKNSVLGQPDSGVLLNLGLKPSIEDATQVFPNSKNVLRRIINLVPDGADFEDDNVRSLNHFFDPANDRGLTFGIVSAGFKSPDWALKALHTIGDDQQAFSLKDARDYLFKALTATTAADRDKYFGLTFQTLGHVIHHLQDMTQPQHTRNDDHCPKELPCKYPGGVVGAYNPSLYESWTNQYREQPFITQHLIPGLYPKVRFDTARKYWHTENKNPGAGQGIAEFTNSNFVSAGTNFREAFQNGQLTALPNERYALPVPSINTPRYEDANTLLSQAVKPVPAECLPPNAPCLMGFVSSEVKDNHQPQKGGTNSRASAVSIFDQDLNLHGKTVPYVNLDKCTNPGDPTTCEKIDTNRIFTLNEFTFREAHRFLLTRAVAYSAGLIDYFFRGRLEIQDAGYTDTGVSLRVRNAIDPDAEPVWKNETLATGGELRVAFDYKLDGKLVVGASAPVTLTEDIKPGMASAGYYSFTLPEIPDNATDIRYRLVFRGRLGKEEGAVAVGTFKPMSGFVVTPSYTPTDGITNSDGSQTRLIYKPHGQNAKWRLSPEANIKAGNVDWRGWYVNGNPTKLLTWIGARARYMPDREVCMYHPAGCRWASSSATGNEIYQGGERFAVAPGPVLGAAVTRDSQGKDWLVVITLDGPNLGEVVWRRSYEKSNSDSLYDPTSAPKGWQEIGRFKGSDYGNNAANRINHHADIPWFFNGNGTRAQTMRRWWDTSNNRLQQRLDRLEISIVDDVTHATFTNHQNLAGILSSSTCSSSYDADGAGGGSRNSTGSGELVVAVDFNDDKPLLARVKVESSGNTTSTVTVTKDSNGRVTATNGQYANTGSQKDTFFWGDGTGLNLSTGNWNFKSKWSSGSGTSTYNHDDVSSTQNMEIGYYFDLRFNLFSYYEYSYSDKTNLSIVDGVRTNTGSSDFSESHRIDSAIGESRVPYSFKSNYTFTPNEPTQYALNCSSSDTLPATTTYGYNFPWFFETTGYNVGGWAVDLNKRMLVSQYIFSDVGYKEEFPYSVIIPGSTSPTVELTNIVPGGSGQPVFFPVGAVR